MRSSYLAIVWLTGLIGCASLPAAEVEPPRPNIVLIMSDDMGFSDLGCYGGEIRTPHLDRLAANGLRFTQFYNCARCCPTRAALLTGVYPHQAGIGLMTGDRQLPGYQGRLGRNVMTIAEALRSGGYRTYMSGKWHVAHHIGPNGPKDGWPLQRGFERFYGTIIGAGSFYDPATLCRGDTYITPENDPEYRPETYYYTDAISDNAVAFLREHEASTSQEPFFLYVAYTCAHWPMHALPEDIERYRGRYDEGFEAIRAQRHARLIEMGLIDPSWPLSHGTDAWEGTPHQDWELRNMEVYAAMIDRMDQGIGQILSELERQGARDDTLVLFLQDNGGCAEGNGRRAPKDPYPTDLEPLGPDELQMKIWPPMQTRDGRPVRVGPDVMAGAAATFIAYGRGWANVSNTPFREFKHFAHEGGVATPQIVHWPAGVSSSLSGSLVHDPGHVIDLMATCLDAAGVPYPERSAEEPLIPLEGISLTPAFRGRPLDRPDALYWEHHLNSAVRDGRWKLVRKGRTKGCQLDPWELYDLANDRAETRDLAAEHPDIVQRLAAQWESWADRVLVHPWPWKGEGE